MWKEYYTPNPYQGVLKIINQYQEKGRIVAGATDLILS